MNRNVLIILVAILITPLLQAQNVNDALRYSAFDFSGTARFAAVGGALGPLGADIGVAGTNPAGLSLFRRSEFTVTPAIFNSSPTVRAGLC